MASDDVRALAERIVAGLQQYGDKGLRLQMEALARAVLALAERPTCGTCRHYDGETGIIVNESAFCSRLGRYIDDDWSCADHEPAPPDQPREDEP